MRAAQGFSRRVCCPNVQNIAVSPSGTIGMSRIATAPTQSQAIMLRNATTTRTVASAKRTFSPCAWKKLRRPPDSGGEAGGEGGLWRVVAGRESTGGTPRAGTLGACPPLATTGGTGPATRLAAGDGVWEGREAAG